MYDEETEELENALEQVDELVDGIGTLIIEIANANKDFTCSSCLRTATELYELMKNYARDEDCDSIREQYVCITGRDLDE